ncbi:substrate-binding periplasmic protein [Bermanella sp. WJH001]|uniref:substrate-binding periplasmic protein n=1 Tax=Bermanella sp. WJH001 TaxID=3048005 RepID=UPI0024BE8E62|nr:transporter substrate-binding domain-containing protein [Bermanella sp. WJH001]MDJ1537815.1 transporter substrate-binding domain-containing protein [Bermanella sp. WJH001]
MQMFVRILFVMSLLVSTMSYGEEKVVYFTSLDWPPYSGADLPHQGRTIQHATQIFASMGYTLKIDFFPWSRAVNLGLADNSKYTGYLPEYYDESLTQVCTFSEPIGFSPLGFAQLKSAPVQWQSLEDIAKLPKIGVVRNYINTKELDDKIESGDIKGDIAGSDVENIKKLAGKRIPIIVIDERVLEYWLSHEPELIPIKNKIEFNTRLLEKKNLYLCFKKDEQGQKLLKIFNDGLNKQQMKSFMRQSVN